MNTENKTIVAVDIESTGRNVRTDRILQISLVKFSKDDYSIIDEWSSYIKPDGSVRIALSAFLVHGITAETVKDAPTFSEVYKYILDFIGDSALLGYNLIKFDLPIMRSEFSRINIDWDFSKYTIYDSFKEETRRNSNKLACTFERYTGKTMLDAGYSAHDALSDSLATIEVFKYQNKNEVVDPENVLSMDGMIGIQQINDKDTICFTVGKYYGVPVDYVAKNDKQYINYVLSNKDIDSRTKEIVQKINYHYL